jgi:hypothetical protein
MIALKAVRYFLLMMSVLGVVLPLISTSFRQKTIDRYNLRWHQDYNDLTRVQTVTVRNAGDEQTGNLVLEIIPSKANQFRDFETASTEYSPAFSLLNFGNSGCSASDCSDFLSKSERDRIARAADIYKEGGFGQIENIFNQILLERIKTTNDKTALRILGENPLITPDFHRWWHDQCEKHIKADQCEKVDELVSRWEGAKRAYYNEKFENWERSFGISVVYGKLKAGSVFVFTFQLDPGEARIFRLHNAHLSGQTLSSLRSNRGLQTTLVSKSNDLYSSWFSLFSTFHPILTILSVILILALVPFIRFFLPLHLISTRRLFDVAVSTGDHQFWKEALERYRFNILQQYSELKRRFNSKTAIEGEEVINHVRSQMIERFRAGKLKLATQTQLDLFIRDELEELIRNN